MNRLVASTIALVLASTETVRAEDPENAVAAPARAKPFLAGEEENLITVTGAFGPANDTMMVFSFSRMTGDGTFSGFALVPDAKAKHGERKVALPKLPQDSSSGEMNATLVANLDNDADDELVVGFRVFRTVRDHHGGGFSYNIWEYAVLDWNRKKFVRLPALEKKLAAKADSREIKGSVLTEEDARAALGVTKKP
jgi:hypothetical protein